MEKEKIWNKVGIATRADQNIVIYPTEVWDGIILETKELDDSPSTRLYLTSETEMEFLITKMREMMKYVLEK